MIQPQKCAKCAKIKNGSKQYKAVIIITKLMTSQKVVKNPLSSFPRTRESSKINQFWTPASAGVTALETFYETIKVDLPFFARPSRLGLRLRLRNKVRRFQVPVSPLKRDFRFATTSIQYPASRTQSPNSSIPQSLNF